MSFKLILAVAATVAAHSVQAECYLRSVTSSTKEVAVQEYDKVYAYSKAGANGSKTCVAGFKALVGTKWYPASGEQSYSSPAQEQAACDAAIEHAKRSLATQVNEDMIAHQADMVCEDFTDGPKTVQIGDIVKQSDVNPHPHRMVVFYVNSAPCRFFVESSMIQDVLYEWTGVICKIGSQGDSWQVIDKY